jgi:copper resistance protein C
MLLFFVRTAVTALLLVPLLGDAFAHAVVTESSLQTQPVHPQQATTVVLNFNAGVELALSRVFLVSKGDVHQPAEIVAGKKPGQVLVRLPALNEGEYAIKYKIFAADGHFTENVIRFSVHSADKTR